MASPLGAKLIDMSYKLLSVFGILVAIVCLGLATTTFPGGFDWNRNYISSMLRGPAGPTRTLADIGAICFCVSIGSIFPRLAKAPEFAARATIIQIAGIGSMVYSCLTMTPLHDLMVTISVAFFVAAVVPLAQSLYVCRERGLFLLGCASFIVFLATATMYYSGTFTWILPRAQRVTYVLFAVWLVALDFRFPRERLKEIKAD